MDLTTKCLLINLKLLLLILADGGSTCTIKLFDDCTHTITCPHRPTAVNNLPCSGVPNVTFVITDSVLNTLTSSFFSSTNFDGRVKYITSQDNTWYTIETHAFKYYPKTVLLNLTATGIVNINNEAFMQLVYLTTLNLSNNNIERLSDRSFFMAPENVLEHLDLSQNKLTHLQDDVFSSLTYLLGLFLQNNRISTMSNDCFTNLKQLAILFLQNNNLTSLNSTAVPLRQLKYLQLSNNKIQKLTGFETSRLGALVYLNISYNILEIVEVNCFTLSVNLEYLDLSHNKISSPIEPVMFMNNHLLRHLNLFDNKISTVKDLSFQFNSIEYINIEGNNLSIDINRDTMKGLYMLTAFNITGQNISSIKEKAFIDMQDLNFLNLSRNNIYTVDNTSFEFENISVLATLDLSYNFISDLFFLQRFTSNLKEFYITNNKIAVLRSYTFKNHKNLIKFDVSENEILVIEQGSLPLASVQYLHFQTNNLNGNITKYMFSPAPFLRYLDINNSKFQRINENAFVNLQLLTKLNISYNELEFIDSENFINMDKMYSLDISHNKLSNFSVNKTLDKLKAIYLNDNNFTRLPTLFSNVSCILYIDVSNNFISDLNHAGFENVTNITVLKMSNNSIKTFNSEVTNKLTRLSDLILSSNHISEINLTCFEGLVSVDLSYNNISFINQTILEYLHSLQYLDLSGNKITKLPPGSFQHLKILKFLNLSSNYIETLRFGIFRGLAKTETIDVSKNRITYLDINIFHECNALKNLIIDYNFIKTVNVDGLISLSPNIISLSLGGNPISCEEIVRNHRLKDSKRLQVTSIDKIFHEDNVHGIKCGDTIDSTLTERPQEKKIDVYNESHDVIGKSTSTILIIWCVILTILTVLAIAYFFYTKRGKIVIRGEPRAYQSNSLNISSIDYNNDLLS